MRRVVPSAIAALLLGCVVMFEAEAPFEGEHSLEEVHTLQLELPQTAITVQGDADSLNLSYTGRFIALGGTSGVAIDSAEAARLRYEREDFVARLWADIPLELDGLVALELDELTMSASTDLEIEGEGDVHVGSMTGHILIDVSEGDVEVFGGDDGVGIYTGSGDIAVESAGPIDAKSEGGSISVDEEGFGRDVIVRAENGDITVRLASDANIDLEIEADGEYEIATTQIASNGFGTYEREVGNGSVRVSLRAPRGNVELRMLQP